MQRAPVLLAAMLALALPAAIQRPTSQDPVTPTGNDVFMEAVVDEKPALLSAPQLVYPELLRQAGIQGRVLVRAIIDTMGRAEPNSVTILQSPNPGFDRSVKDYVLKTMFRPARIHGRAVRVLIQMPIAFALNGAHK